jgi:hypothetical protein
MCFDKWNTNGPIIKTMWIIEWKTIELYVVHTTGILMRSLVVSPMHNK